MAKLVYHSDDSFVAFGRSGSALTQNDTGSLFPLVQSVSVSVDVAGSRQTSKFLGRKTFGVNDIIKQPTVSVNLGYYLSPYGVNEHVCGISGTGQSGIDSFITPLRTYSNNIYLAFNNKEPQEGFDEPRDQVDNDWNSYSFMNIGNCYLTNYSLNFSINEPVKASVSFIGDNMSAPNVSNGTIPVPSRLADGSATAYILDLDQMYNNFGTGVIARPEGRTIYNPSVTLPYKCTVQLSEIQGGGISIATGALPVIQSVSFNVSIERTPFYGLGGNYPITRKASLPIDGSLDVDFLISGIRTGELDTLVSSETGHYIKLKCGDFKDTGIFLIYEIQKARLQSASYSCDINNVYKCQMKFSFEDFGYSRVIL